jgi:hypothetical protein
VRRISKYIYIFETNWLTTWILKLLGGKLTDTQHMLHLKSNYSADFSLAKSLERANVFYEYVEATESLDLNDQTEFSPMANQVLPFLHSSKVKEKKNRLVIQRTFPAPKRSIHSKNISKYATHESDSALQWPDASQQRLETKDLPYSKSLEHEGPKGSRALEVSKDSHIITGVPMQLTKDRHLRTDIENLPSAGILPNLEGNPEWTYGYDDQYKRKVLSVTVKMIEKMDHQDAADFMETLDPFFADELLRGVDIPPVVKGIVLSKKVGLGKVTLASFLESQKTFKEKTFAEKIAGGKDGN